MNVEKILYSCVGYNSCDLNIINRLYDELDDMPLECSRHVDALRMRYGLYPYNEPMLLRIIGKRLGITQQRVRQLIYKAVKMLESPGRKRRIFEGSFI